MADTIESKIGELMVITGDIRCESRVIVEGKISGSFTGQVLVVGENGQVEGDVAADVIECLGRIEGDIVTTSFTLCKSGYHVGTVETAELTVEPGAILGCALQSGASKRHQITEEAKVREVERSRESVLQALLSSFQAGRFCCMDLPNSSRQKLYTSLLGLVKRGKQLIKVTGANGSGKSTLVEKLQDCLPEKIETYVVTNQVGSVVALLEQLGSDLGIEGNTARSQREVLEHIKLILADKKDRGCRVLLLVDDAQDMYPASMEGIIRHLTNAYGEGEDMLQLILLGTNDMKGKMVTTTLEYFEDETNCQLVLQPLNMKEVADYLEFALQLVAGETAPLSTPLFTYETIKKIHATSGGNIAAINMLTERALQSAVEVGAKTVEPDFV